MLTFLQGLCLFRCMRAGSMSQARAQGGFSRMKLEEYLSFKTLRTGKWLDSAQEIR